jgi:hypothetical protein
MTKVIISQTSALVPFHMSILQVSILPHVGVTTRPRQCWRSVQEAPMSKCGVVVVLLFVYSPLFAGNKPTNDGIWWQGTSPNLI